MTRTPRPRDPIQLAKLVMEIATGEDPDFVEDGKDPHAVALGRKGAAARNAALTPQQRVEIARRAAKARWSRA